MAARQFPRIEQMVYLARIAQMPPKMALATLKWERIALKWRDLAERRRAHHIDLYESGRWKHYYTDIEFLNELRAAIIAANRWGKLAPRPEELAEVIPAPVKPASEAALPAVEFGLPSAA